MGTSRTPRTKNPPEDEGKSVSRPVSRVLYGAARMPHATTIHLGRPSPDASRNQPGRLAWKRAGTLADPAPPLFGFAPGGVYRAASVTGRAVGSYPTLSPLPRPKPGRFAFCGTFPGVAPAGRYPAPCFRGARTFLPSGLSADAGAAARPAGRPYVARRAHIGNSVAPRTRDARPAARANESGMRWGGHEKGARHNGQTPVEGGANRYSHKTMTKGIT